MKAIILAAGLNKRMKKYVTNKSLLKVKNKRLIDNIIDNFKKNNLNDILVVTGHNNTFFKKKVLQKNSNINFINNKNYKNTNIIDSLMLALNTIDDDVIISYADIYYKKNLISKLIKNTKNFKNNSIILPVLKNWLNIWKLRKQNIESDAETLIMNKSNSLLSIGNKIENIKKVDAQFMGVIYIPKKLIKILLNLYYKKNLKNIDTTTFLNKIISYKIKIKCFKYYGIWYEFDNYLDYTQFNKQYKNK